LVDNYFRADGRPSFYSHENAPGIIMAVGNTGEYLDFAADAMCTWLSRDGGATWEDVADHAVMHFSTVQLCGRVGVLDGQGSASHS
jgi:hypothetical protein